MVVPSTPFIFILEDIGWCILRRLQWRSIQDIYNKHTVPYLKLLLAGNTIKSMYCSKMTLPAPEWNYSWKVRIILSFQTPNPEEYEKTCGGTRVVPLRVPASNISCHIIYIYHNARSATPRPTNGWLYMWGFLTWWISTVDGVIPGTVFTSISSTCGQDQTNMENGWLSTSVTTNMIWMPSLSHIISRSYLPTSHVNKCINARKAFQT